MQHLTPLYQQEAIGYFLGERMFKGVLWLRKRRLLVDKLCGLQARQESVQLLFGLLHYLLEQAPGELFANH